MKNPSDLDTLAVALAEIGNFDAAVETQGKGYFSRHVERRKKGIF